VSGLLSGPKCGQTRQVPSNSPFEPARERFPLDASVDGAVERFVPVAEGVHLRTLDRGSARPDEPVFILIHGLASNCRMYDGVATHLAERGYRSIAVDLRGHGLSSKPDDGYDFSTVCRDVIGVLDHFELPRAVLVGQSWGGNIVVHAAHEHPGRVVGSVAIDGGAFEMSRRFATWDECAEALAPPRLAGMRAARLEAAIRASNRDWPESGIRGSLSNFQFHDDGTLSPWLTFDRHMRILRALFDHRPTELYPLIERPIVFLPADSGVESHTQEREEILSLAQRTLAKCRVHWFRPAHHDLHAQHPERCADVIITNVKNGFLS
jgi:pimeloyl-ACP methyl ester carboxylesterase